MPAPVRLHRRRPRPGQPLGRAAPASAGGSTRRRAAPFAMERFAHNTWRSGPRPGAARRRDERRRPPPPRPRAAARRRRQQRDRPRRPAGRAASTGSTAASTGLAAARTRRRVDRRALRDGVRGAHRRRRRRRLAAAAVRARAGPARPRRRTRASLELRLSDVRALLAVAAGRPPDPGQLPHRHPDRLHDGADALGARTGSSAWSASTTASSRARGAVDGDDVLGRAPAHRRARPAQRGPPAAPRRRAGRDRAPRHHLHRRQRAAPARRARPPYLSASCSTPPTAPPPRRCATRCSTRHPLQPYDARNFEPAARPAECRSASTPPPSAGAPVGVERARTSRRRCSTDRCPAAPRDDVSLADLKAFLVHPVRAFLREPARRVDAVRARRARRRDPGRRSTPSRSGRSATTCCASCSPGRTRSR